MTDKSKFRIELSERGDDEPNATDRQIRFIGHLLDEIESEGFSYDITSLGKWQASSLINRLLEIQDGVDSHRVSIQEPAFRFSRMMKLLFWLIIIFFVILFMSIFL